MRASIDRTLVALIAVIATLGVIVFFSAALPLLVEGPRAFTSALISQLGLGLVGGSVAAYMLVRVPLSVYRTYAPHIFVAGIVLTALVFAPYIGVSANGASRWIDLGFTTFQPSEFLKIGYILLVAAILARGKELGADYRRGVIPVAAVSILVAVLLLLQPDTDTLVLMLAASGAMLFASGLSYRDIGIGIAIVALGVAILASQRPYLLDRFTTYWNPSNDPQGAGYHVIQSTLAVGAGEAFGRGYGLSVQKFTHLPEASSDAIFAVYAEEFGFIGSILLVALMSGFILRGLWLAARAQELFGALTALGIVTLLGSQMLLNIAAMIGLVPVGGFPLPFVSQGGSALFMTLALSGILLAVSKTVRR